MGKAAMGREESSWSELNTGIARLALYWYITRQKKKGYLHSTSQISKPIFLFSEQLKTTRNHKTISSRSLPFCHFRE